MVYGIQKKIQNVGRKEKTKGGKKIQKKKKHTREMEERMREKDRGESA